VQQTISLLRKRTAGKGQKQQQKPVFHRVRTFYSRKALVKLLMPLAGLLTRSSHLPFPNRQGEKVVYRFSAELTAAGTVPDFHRIPFLSAKGGDQKRGKERV